MAENITAESRGRKGRRMQKKSTRVDLTPMVDLGFLLITFFVFTTSMTEPKVMNMVSPKNIEDVNDPICESCAITVIAGGNDKLYYYEGKANGSYKETDYSAEGLRALMIRKKKDAAAIKRDAVLIIKQTEQSTFKNMVDIIDEAAITTYKRYYFDKLNDEDKQHVR